MLRRTTLLAGIAGLLAACQLSDQPTAAGSDAQNRKPDFASDPTPPTVQHQVDRVRAATKAFKKFTFATDAATAGGGGYTVQVTDCMEHLPLGTMGFHYANADLLDASLDPLKPEALLYEPVRGGGFKLVGVEYLVPYNAWTSPTPPMLFGQSFLRNDTFKVWALHFWIWTENPSGYFADWNPLVSCHRAATP
ncbi:MAG: hypothetical protein ABI647_12290 [Gemmatimonadota bacterium]